MNRGAWKATAHMGSKKVRHDLATKQQQQGWNCEASWSTLLSASSVTTVQFSTGGSDEGI